MDWFPYDRDLGYDRIKQFFETNTGYITATSADSHDHIATQINSA